MGNAAHSKLGRSVCTVRISGNFPYPVLLFKTHTFCRRRLVHFPLSIIGLIFNPIRARYIQKKKWKQILLNEMEILAVDICMVLSGMGTELLTEELSMAGQTFLILPILPKSFSHL